jgi:two-component system sensor histidine kinase YesM
MTVPYQQTVLVMTTDMLRNNLIILAILVPVMMLFVFLAASFTTKPLKELTINVQNQTRAFPLSAGGRNEISVLIQSYNTMLDQVAETIKQQYELGQRIKTLELKSLRAQINPHFLYNTLELLHWMAFTAGEREIDKVLMAMADFYRLSLRSGEDMSTIEKELHHIEMYLTIQNARMDNKISFVTNIPNMLLSCVLPTITLQPLVENSVIHGIMEKEEERGVIAIGACSDGDDLIISIHDDGIGIPEEKLKTILFSSSKSGYGVNNVHERIQIAFGQQYGLCYESIQGEGVTVKIRLKKKMGVDRLDKE